MGETGPQGIFSLQYWHLSFKYYDQFNSKWLSSDNCMKKFLQYFPQVQFPHAIGFVTWALTSPWIADIMSSTTPVVPSPLKCKFLTCLRKWLGLLKALGQKLHLYGRSPVCIRTCLWRFPEIENALEQYWHWYGCSPVWTRRCFRRELYSANDW